MRFVIILAALSLAVTHEPASAEQRIGVAVDAKELVTSLDAAGEDVLVASAPVFLNERLIANDSGLAQLELADDTRIVVGPNTDITLDEFVFSGDRSAKTVAVSVSKGAFRFISGLSGSNAYSINTPDGTIGVRGTAFDVTISGGLTNLLLLNGQVSVCPQNAACRTVRRRCDYVSFSGGGFVESANLLRRANLSRFESLFPLIGEQKELQRNFRRETAGCNNPSLHMERGADGRGAPGENDSGKGGRGE